MRILNLFLFISAMAYSSWGAAPNASDFRERWSDRFPPPPPIPMEPELHYQSPVTQRTNTFSLILHGQTPEAMAMTVTLKDQSPDSDSAQWGPFKTNLTVDFGPGEGPRYLWLGYRHTYNNGYSADWRSYPITVQLAPPIIGITSPKERILARPMIQLQGFCSTDLGRPIPYEVHNQQGVVTSRGEGLVNDAYYDKLSGERTTNYFTCYDVQLSPGTNTIVLHFKDMAGYSVTTNVAFVFTTAGKTNAPVFTLDFPQDGILISGSEFTLDGPCDDPTVTVTALICDDSGRVTRLKGLVGRNGHIWVEHIPLVAGISYLTVVACDVAGNSSLTNLTLGRAKYTLEMDPVADPQQLWQRTIKVTGYFSRTNGSVSVNGVRAKMLPDGHWVAEKVPVRSSSGQGTASFSITAEPDDEQLTPSHVWQPTFFGAGGHSLQAALSFLAAGTNEYNHYSIALGVTNVSGSDQHHRWMLPNPEGLFTLRLLDQNGQLVSPNVSPQRLATVLPGDLNIHHLGSEELESVSGILPLRSNAAVQTAEVRLLDNFPMLPPGDYQVEVVEQIFEIAQDGRLLPVRLPAVKACLKVLEQPSETSFYVRKLTQEGLVSWGAVRNGLRIGIAQGTGAEERGRGAELEVFLENLGTNQTQSLFLPRLEEQYEISLRDGTGAEVPKTALGKARGEPLVVPRTANGPIDQLNRLAHSMLGKPSLPPFLHLVPAWLPGWDAVRLGTLKLNDLFEIKGKGKYRLEYQQRLLQMNGTNGFSERSLPKVTFPLNLP